MASTSPSHQQNASFGIEPPHKRRKVEESSRLFDVFINHRGPDVKLTLAIQLYNTLKDLNIKAFLDSEEKELGESFPSTIETAIRSASVHVAIFSKSYAESAWCLAELVLMLQSKAKIIPLFYQVEPWELRHIEKGVYARAFLKYAEKGRYLDKVDEWKKALQQVSYTAGCEYKNSDFSDCKNIVSAVEKEVQMTKLLHVAKYPVGLHKFVKEFERQCLDKLVQDFESHCGMKQGTKERANVIGIFGMGGVGKTTLSKELFNLKRSKYTRACFLFDVREGCASGKLLSLQSKLLKDIFCEDHSFQSSEEGTSCLRDRLERSGSFSFLIVLDDIDHVEQLDALLVMDKLNKSGNNLILITTRDVGVLVSAGIDLGYHLKGLDREDGRELFCWHAFNKPLPLVGYEVLVQDFVNMCGGLPLSIIVLGRHVFGRAPWYWQNELEKVKNSLPGDIKRRLKISIDTLDNVEKQIFIDVACFFIEKSITMSMTIWKGSGWRARHALETLKEKCLVEEVEVSCRWEERKWDSRADRFVLRMHDHLRDLGREMANELTQPRRVWHPQHLRSLELKGFRNILAQTKGRCFHSIWDNSIDCEITYFLGESEYGSDTSLLWLELKHPSYNSSIFSWIPLQNLQCLRIIRGCFQRLWQSDVQVPSNLKELQIHDTFLEEIPELGKLNNMEKLVLHAGYIQTDIWSLLKSIRMNLRSLKMMGWALVGDLACTDTTEGIAFKSLVIYDSELLWRGEMALNKEGTVMSNVEYLEINGHGLVMKILINGNCCQRLRFLKICEMNSLFEVDLARIKTLNCLEITGCKKLKRLSATPDLCKLVELKMSKCVELEELLSVAGVSCLEKMEIDFSEKLQIIMLPTTIIKLYVHVQKCTNLQRVVGAGDLTKLTELIIKKCPVLEELPGLAVSCLEKMEIDFSEKLQNIMLPTTIIKLYVQKCTNLQRVLGGGDLTKLTELIIKKCPALEELPSLAVSCLEKMEIDFSEKLQNIMLPTTIIKLYVQKCTNLQRVLEGGDLTKLTELIIKKCPALEELPSLAVSCLEKMEVDFSEKLHNIMLPTTIIKLYVQKCTNLQRLLGAGDLTKLTELIIKKCLAPEELPSLAVSCLDKMEIDFCEKLQNIMLPTTLIELYVQKCRNLQRVLGAGDLTKFTKLIIKKCPVLEELPSFVGVSCLEEIEINCCEKLENIMLPTTLIKLYVQKCRNLQRVLGASDLTKFTELIIKKCPALEELPSLVRVSCLQEIEIKSCEKLQNIMLPTTLNKLDVQNCRDLQRVSASDHSKLTWLIIKKCPALEELPSLVRVSCLEEIEIEFCEKLQNIMLPTTLKKLNLQSCRDLQRVAAGDLTKLTQLIIIKCPALEELPSLARVSYLEEIKIESCEKLQNISGVEELHVPKYMKLCYCGNRLIWNCIQNLKSAPAMRMCMIGRAADEGESRLNEYLFTERNIGVDAVIEIGSENTVFKWSELSFIIGCFVVVVDNSISAEDTNRSLLWN